MATQENDLTLKILRVAARIAQRTRNSPSERKSGSVLNEMSAPSPQEAIARFSDLSEGDKEMLEGFLQRGSGLILDPKDEYFLLRHRVRNPSEALFYATLGRQLDIESLSKEMDLEAIARLTQRRKDIFTLVTDYPGEGHATLGKLISKPESYISNTLSYANKKLGLHSREQAVIYRLALDRPLWQADVAAYTAHLQPAA